MNIKKWDKKYFRWGLTAFVVIAASILFYMIVSASKSIADFFAIILNAFTPMLIGFGFAFVLKPLLRLLEFPVFYKWGQKLFKDNDRKARGFSRMLGLVLTTITVIVILGLLLWMIIPKVYESVQTIVSNLPAYYSSIRNAIESALADTSLGNTAVSALDSLNDKIQGWLSNDLLSFLGQYANTFVSGVVNVISILFNYILGIIIAIYVLAEKEKFGAQSKKILYSTLKVERATSVINRAKSIDRIFTGFISGKIVDSIIVGIVFYIVLAIFDMPYKELVAVFLAVTNIIPFFGPFIGAIPSALLILLVSPVKCLVFIIIVIVIQQLDGNILGPRILGESTGLSSFWVLCSLLIFGRLFGFVGMLIGVPTFAVIYAFIKEEIHEKLRKKNITRSTTKFKDIDYIDPETEQPVMKTEETKKEKKASTIKNIFRIKKKKDNTDNKKETEQ